MKSILEIIREKYEELSPKAKQLAKYIMLNYKNVAVMNVSTLAKASGVSSATVVRFAMEIGCDGYAQMQEELQKVLFNYYSSEDEIQQIGNESAEETSQVERVLAKMPEAFEKRDRETIQKAADLIFRSRNVFLVGNQISGLFLSYTQYLLSKYKKNIYCLSDLNMREEDMLQESGKEDCAIVFALQRYPNFTLKCIRKLKEAGIPMIIFTDSNLFPYAEWAEHIIYTPTRELLILGQLITIYSIVYEIILLIIEKDPAQAREQVQRFEKYVRENDIYFKMSYDMGADAENFIDMNDKEGGEKNEKRQ